MLMPPGLRKLALTAHVALSVGWLGAVIAFLVLAIVGLRSPDAAAVRSAYVASDAITRYAIVPLGIAALVSGLVQSLGTTWGLFRHYWVLVKLLLTIGATLLLLLHTGAIAHAAELARAMDLAPGDEQALRVQLVADAAAAIAVLLAATVLSVFKPRGLTRYGWRKEREERRYL